VGRGEWTEIHGQGNFIIRAAAVAQVFSIPRVEPDTTVFAAAVQGAGTSILWDGRDDLGEAMATGVCFLRFVTGTVSKTRRLLLK
jgi:hypothetical protein